MRVGASNTIPLHHMALESFKSYRVHETPDRNTARTLPFTNAFVVRALHTAQQKRWRTSGISQRTPNKPTRRKSQLGIRTPTADVVLLSPRVSQPRPPRSLRPQPPPKLQDAMCTGRGGLPKP